MGLPGPEQQQRCPQIGFNFLVGHCQIGSFDSAYMVFDRMGFVKFGFCQMDVGRQFISLLITAGLGGDVCVGSSVVHKYAKCRNLEDEADDEVEPSMLGLQSYWDAAYADELANFHEHGHAGEIWFGSEVIEIVVNWTKNYTQNLADEASPKCESVEEVNKWLSSWSVLDIGTGNGVLLQELGKEGFSDMTGTDYSEAAINLARNLGFDCDNANSGTSFTMEEMRKLVLYPFLPSVNFLPLLNLGVIGHPLEDPVVRLPDQYKVNLCAEANQVVAACIIPCDLVLDVFSPPILEQKLSLKKFCNPEKCGIAVCMPSDRRFWFRKGQVAGWATEYGNLLSFTTVSGAATFSSIVFQQPITTPNQHAPHAVLQAYLEYVVPAVQQHPQCHALPQQPPGRMLCPSATNQALRTATLHIHLTENFDRCGAPTQQNATDACGIFHHGDSDTSGLQRMFSYVVSWEKGARGSSKLFPTKGDVWALYKAWDIRWSSDPGKHKTFQSEIGEVISDFYKETGVADLAEIAEQLCSKSSIEEPVNSTEHCHSQTPGQTGPLEQNRQADLQSSLRASSFSRRGVMLWTH